LGFIILRTYPPRRITIQAGHKNRPLDFTQGREPAESPEVVEGGRTSYLALLRWLLISRIPGNDSLRLSRTAASLIRPVALRWSGRFPRRGKAKID
jgi:hypothetical protein